MKSRGFIAVTAVLILMFATMAFTLTVLAASASYADAVVRREVRIQIRLNVRACSESALLMAREDPFLDGVIYLREFGCSVEVYRSADGTSDVRVHSIGLD